MSSQITEVRLLRNVPLENDYQHTLYFADLPSQESYFKGKTWDYGVDFTYQRKDGVIRYPKNIDQIMYCNYVMYKNTAFNHRWQYAFITKMEYVNDYTTNIYIETDVMQTWFFDYQLKQSFVEREHVKDDTVGLHTVPEQVELGEYTSNAHFQSGYVDEYSNAIIVGVTQTPNGSPTRGKLYNNMYSGIDYYSFDHTLKGSVALRDWLDGYAEDGAVDAITCMFLAPKRLFATMEDGRTIVESIGVDTYGINDTSYSDNVTIAFDDGLLDGYEPVNKKLLTFPYRYLLASNNNGCAVPYYYEEFKNFSNERLTPRFVIEGCLTSGCSVRMIPLNYKGVRENHEEGINLGKYPALNWTSDVFTNWLTQNGVNIGVNLAGSGMQILGGVVGSFMGLGLVGGASQIASGVLGVASTLGEVYAHSLQPPQSSGNINCGDVITASGHNDFHFYEMSIRREYAKIIDGYFTMFGYKVNQLKVPNWNHRSQYWFTKTINVNIDGEVPHDDLQKIKDCYNRGITFWKDPNFIQDYSVLNNIL